jgi:error-prone DNA polymerase
VNASRFRTRGRDREVRIGFQFVKGLSADAVERMEREQETPFLSFEEFRSRTGLAPADLRLLVRVGACDAIAGGRTRPMMLWEIDREAGERGTGNGERGPARPRSVSPTARSSAAPPRLREYDTGRRRRAEYELLGFTTDCHPMALYREAMARFHIVPSTDLARHVGRSVLCAGMLTTAKPVHTIQDEPMEFATFDDGAGLIETVLFPGVYRSRGHVLFDQGPFIFRGKVEEEFGAITVTVTHIDRLERMLEKVGAPVPRLAAPESGS